MVAKIRKRPHYIWLAFKTGSSEFIDDREYIDIQTESIDDFMFLE